MVRSGPRLELVTGFTEKLLWNVSTDRGAAMKKEVKKRGNLLVKENRLFVGTVLANPSGCVRLKGWSMDPFHMVVGCTMNGVWSGMAATRSKTIDCKRSLSR